MANRVQLVRRITAVALLAACLAPPAANAAGEQAARYLAERINLVVGRCAAATSDLTLCDSTAELTPYATQPYVLFTEGPGGWQISATPASATVTGSAFPGTFSIVRDLGGVTARTCSAPATADCAVDGTWTLRGNASVRLTVPPQVPGVIIERDHAAFPVSYQVTLPSEAGATFDPMLTPPLPGGGPSTTCGPWSGLPGGLVQATCVAQPHDTSLSAGSVMLRARTLGSYPVTWSLGPDDNPADNTVSGVLAFTGAPVTSAAGPEPRTGEAAVAATVTGTVLIRRPGAGKAVPLVPGSEVPMGSLVDATRGSLVLRGRVKAGAGSLISGTFSLGVFTVRQRRNGGDIDAVLRRPRDCPRGDLASVSSPRRDPPNRVRVRERRVKAGGFRTIGGYSSGAAIGTDWITTESCRATTTRVIKGLVRVFDRFKGRAVRVAAGQQYVARRG